MCGAFSIIHPFRDISGRFNAGYGRSKDFPPKYNARPTQYLPVILNQHPEEILLIRWGLNLPWTSRPLINVRAESLAEKPTFQQALKLRRCLVLADSFYEWKGEKGKKVPYRFMLKNEDPFAFAGIWNEDKELKEPVFAIVTTEANKIVAEVHNRMPVILKKDNERDWLEEENFERQIGMLKPYPTTQMKSYPISTLVNSFKNDSPEIVKEMKNSS